MLSEVIEILDPKNKEFFVDCTLGGAGYTLAISEKLDKQGLVLSLDMDPMAIENARNILKKKKIKNVVLAQENFKNLKDTVDRELGPEKRFQGIVFDLGLSLAQLEDTQRGFSFKRDTLLDMSFKGEDVKGESSTVGYILNNHSVSDLKKLFDELGEEKLSLRIAKNLEKRRKDSIIRTTGQLKQVIEEAIPGKFLPYKDNIKARIFQALRIVTNQELDNLKQALPQARDLLEEHGVMVVISYHSIEDRIVKKFLEKESKDCVCPPQIPECRCDHEATLKIIKHKRDNNKSGKKFLTPNEEELQKNPRSRSAKLRAARRIKK